jgi:superoxide reductase
MTQLEKRTVLMCSVCKNFVEVVYTNSGGMPVCCGKPMEKLELQTADFKLEKHVPYIEKQKGGYLVKVGKEMPHPMTTEHHIIYIELCADGMLMRKYLKPGDKPEAFFNTDATTVFARSLCNIHKLWKSNQ